MGIGTKGGTVREPVHELVQYPIDLLHFHFTSIRPTIPKIPLFQNLTLKNRRSTSWARSNVKVT